MAFTACSVLRALAAEHDNRLPMVSAGAIPRILAALSTHADSAEVVSSACGALSLLAFHNEDNCIAIAAAGAIAPIMTALAAHGTDAAMAARTFCALCNLAGNADNMAAIRAANAVPRVKAVLAAHTTSQAVTTSAHSLLSALGEAVD